MGMILAILTTLAFAQPRVADMSFPGYDFHIGVELGPNTQSFKLCDNVKNVCVPLNDCAYLESNLASAVATIDNGPVRKNLRRLFFSMTSGPGDAPIQEFYPAFKRVLEASGSCPVPDLPEAEARLKGRAG